MAGVGARCEKRGAVAGKASSSRDFHPSAQDIRDQSCEAAGNPGCAMAQFPPAEAPQGRTHLTVHEDDQNAAEKQTCAAKVPWTPARVPLSIG